MSLRKVFFSDKTKLIVTLNQKLPLVVFVSKTSTYSFVAKMLNKTLQFVLTTHRLAYLCCQCDASPGVTLALIWK